MKTFILVAIFFFIQIIFVNAQIQRTIQLPFETLTIDDGLPQGFITGMVQDKQGFIWLSTNGGLARYDGKKIKVFYQDASDSNSLSTNVINYLSIDKENNIWIQEGNGITDILNPVTEKFRHLSKEKEFAWLNSAGIGKQYKIFEDNLHKIYIIYFNKQLSKFEMRYFSWQQTKPQLISFPNSEYPVSVTEGSSGEIWLTTNKALYVSVNHQAFRKKCALPDELCILKTPEDISAFRIQVTKENNFLINNRWYVWQYNIQNDRWKKIKFPSYIPASSKKQIEIAPDKNLYLADTNKIYKINKDESLTLIWTNELKPGNFSMMIDRSNVLWVATNTFGARMIDLNYPGFNSMKIKNGFFQDILWAWNKIPVNNKRINTNKFNDEAYNGCSSFDKSGNLWIANFPYEKIDGQKVASNSFIKITKLHTTVYNINKGLPANTDPGVANLSFDPQNRCWAVLQNAELVQVDLTNKEYLNPFKLNSNNTNPNYLLATGNGLCLVYSDALQFFNANTKKIVWYKDQPGVQAFHNAFLLMAANDPKNKNILWVTSRGNGLIRFNIKTGTAKSFTTKDSLPNNTVYTIVADKEGYFWCSSNKGIFRFNPSNYSVLSFTAKDGLQGNEFNRYQFMCFPDAKIAFGGTEGYTIFDSDSIKIDNYQPAIALTDVAINNEPITKYPAWNNIAIASIDTMRLSYDQNFLTFHFAGMEYNNPEKLQYRYMLIGVDKNWVDAGTQNSANYTNLFPGSYDLKLNASNTAGLWSSHIKIIHIIITPPWWKTWWFYALIVIITAVLIYSIYQYRLNQILKLYVVRNRIATDLHDEIGSSLSTISIYSKVAQEQLRKDAAESSTLLKKISEDTNEMMDAMNDIVWTINARNDRFENIMNRMREHAVQLFEAKDYLLHFNFDEQLNHLKFKMEKRRDFYLIYKEALNNIAKYAEAENVWIDLSSKNAVIKLSIKDDGKGFDVNSIRSSANGLVNMQHRAENLKGEIKIKSALEKGTEICLSFPYH